MSREEKIMMNELTGMSREAAEREADTLTFKNKNFTTRDYEATNIVFCRGLEKPSDNWVVTQEEIPAQMTQLHMTDGVRYYGYL